MDGITLSAATVRGIRSSIRRSPSSRTTNQSPHRQRVAELKAAGLPETCVLCGDTINAHHKLHAHHVLPVADGGENGPLVLVHALCNMQAGAR